ncbi:septum formation family protein [Actinomadura chibensis]|uniref:septum formation family protein n=1 Tax=Actinomadura chibensis TaxID=392828 RepID=UPI000836B465|nr:septum formation family protein [Actinomadura chibensis]
MTTPPPPDGDQTDVPASAPGWVAPHGPLPAAPRRRTNPFAIVALLCGLFGLVLFAIGFAVAAFVQTGRRGERGRGLAVAGLVAAAAWVAVIAAVLVATSLLTADRDESGHVTGKDKLLPGMLHVGDCFTGLEGVSSRSPVTAMPCSRPHEGEAVAELRLPRDPWPGDREVLERASDACHYKTAQLMKSRYAEHLEAYAIPPNKPGWDAGDRRTLCILRYIGPAKLTVPLAETLDPSKRLWRELRRGDCLAAWAEGSIAQSLLPCDKAHWSQVYAVYRLPSGPYPGDKALQRKAKAGCDARWPDGFSPRERPEMVRFAYPVENEWKAGIRTAVCLGEADKKPLKKSMLRR